MVYSGFSFLEGIIELTEVHITAQEAFKSGLTTLYIIRVNCGTLWALIEQGWFSHVILHNVLVSALASSL